MKRMPAILLTIALFLVTLSIQSFAPDAELPHPNSKSSTLWPEHGIAKLI